MQAAPKWSHEGIEGLAEKKREASAYWRECRMREKLMKCLQFGSCFYVMWIFPRCKNTVFARWSCCFAMHYFFWFCVLLLWLLLLLLLLLLVHSCNVDFNRAWLFHGCACYICFEKDFILEPVWTKLARSVERLLDTHVDGFWVDTIWLVAGWKAAFKIVCVLLCARCSCRFLMTSF